VHFLCSLVIQLFKKANILDKSWWFVWKNFIWFVKNDFECRAKRYNFLFTNNLWLSLKLNWKCQTNKFIRLMKVSFTLYRNIYFLFLVIYSALILIFGLYCHQQWEVSLGYLHRGPEGKYKTFWAFFASQVFH